MLYSRKDDVLYVSNLIICIFTIFTGLSALITIVGPSDGLDIWDFMLIYVTIIQISVYLVSRIGCEMLRKYVVLCGTDKILEIFWQIGMYLTLGVSFTNVVINSFISYRILF